MGPGGEDALVPQPPPRPQGNTVGLKERYVLLELDLWRVGERSCVVSWQSGRVRSSVPIGAMLTKHNRTLEITQRNGHSDPTMLRWYAPLQCIAESEQQ